MSKRTVAALLAAVCVSSYAQSMVASDGDQVMRLFDAACTSDEILKAALPKIPEDMRRPLRKAAGTIAGKDWAACWMTHNDHIDVFYEDGDVGYIPMADFKPDGV